MTKNLVPKIEQRQEPWRRMAQQRWHLHASSSSLTRRRGTSSSPTVFLKPDEEAGHILKPDGDNDGESFKV
jgi:hypothetical protein